MVLRSKSAVPSNECCIHPVGTEETSIRYYDICLDLGYIVTFWKLMRVFSLLYFYTRLNLTSCFTNDSLLFREE
jgi:hypothetical protein